MFVFGLGGALGRTSLLLFAGSALAACSGGSGTTAPVTTAPVSMAFGALPSGGKLPDVSYDQASDTVLVKDTSGTTVATLTRNSSNDLGSFRDYNDSSGNYTWIAASPSGDLTGGFGHVSDGTNTGSGVMYSRKSSGTIPASGSATFTGSYGGMATDSSGTIQDAIGGDAKLTADFGAGSVSGTITNRKYYSSPGTSTPTGTLNDLALTGGVIDKTGGFSGSASGGEVSGGSDTTSGGLFQGLFGGTNGSEVVGGVQIKHSQSGYIETGAFIASQ